MRKYSVFQLLGFGAFFVVSLLIMLDVGLSGMFVFGVLHPPCGIDWGKLEDEGFEIVLQAGLEDEDIARFAYWPTSNGATVVIVDGLGGGYGGTQTWAPELRNDGFGLVYLGARTCLGPPEMVTLGAKETDDVLVVLDFLKGRAEVDPERIGLYGFSTGGAAVLMVAGRTELDMTIIAEGNYADLHDHLLGEQKPGIQHWPENIFQWSIGTWYKLLSGIDPQDVSPVESAANIEQGSLFLIYGEYEIENGKGRKIYDAAGCNKDIWIVPGGSHGNNHQAAAELYPKRILNYFREKLENHDHSDFDAEKASILTSLSGR